MLKLKQSYEKCNDLQVGIQLQASEQIKNKKEYEMRIEKELTNIIQLDDITVSLRSQLQDLQHKLHDSENQLQKNKQLYLEIESSYNQSQNQCNKMSHEIQELESQKLTLSSHLTEATGAISKLKVQHLVNRQERVRVMYVYVIYYYVLMYIVLFSSLSPLPHTYK